LAERVEMFLPPDKVTLVVRPGWGHPEGYLFELTSRLQVDLVVVGTHRRHGFGRLRFGSVSRGVLHHASGPVAVVPPTEERKRATIPKLARVLVATDFSDLGNHAVPYGYSILRRGGTLKLIHILKPPRAATTAKHKPRSGKGKPKQVAQLRALVPRGADERIKVEQEIIASADTAEAIAQEAERFRADAICIGSHGRSGLAKTFLGSVAQGVMARSKRPVLIVRPDAA